LKLRNITVIFLKEMLETIRDKRTLMVMVLGPVLVYPILLLAFTQLYTVQEARLQKLRTTVYLREKKEWPELKKALSEEPDLKIVETAESRLKDDAGVLVELDARRAREEERLVPRVMVVYRQTNVYSERGKERVLATLEKYSKEVTRGEVDLRKKERYLHPIIIEEKNLSSRPEQLQSVLAMTLPMILVLMTIAGAMYPAIDTTAGEKERGTIETILASPAGRGEIVYGKFLSVFVICMVTGLLNLAAMSLTFIHILGAFSESIVPFAGVVLVLVSLIPLAVLFSALMMAVSTYARTFREAQNYVTPIYLLCLVPAMMSVQRGFELNDFLCLMPVINMSLLFREVMEGIYRLRHILLVFASTSLYAAAALRGAVKLFRDENALFSLEKPFALFVRRRLLRAKSSPSLGEAVFVCALTFILLYYVSPALEGLWTGASDYVPEVILSEWLLIFLPVVAFAGYLKVDFRNTFSLRACRPVHILAAFLLFGACFFLLLELSVLLRDFLPLPVEFSERISKGVKEEHFWLVVLSMAVSPAVCEETMFRGFLLAGLGKFSRWARILLNGILFGVYHVFFFRIVPTAFLGVVIAFLVVYSRSIFPGMLLHLMNNLAIVVLLRYSEQTTLFLRKIGLGEKAAEWLDGKSHLPWELIAASAGILIVGAAMTWQFRPADRQVGGTNTLAETPLRTFEAFPSQGPEKEEIAKR